ncbi:MAG TPA: helix-turn-helix domain-containing protein [Candidatus Limnocylindrales bacterium]|nr:helix-turn-helix domain-containing protein [Candidatus Limnocylindrales bacterium]
MHGGPDAPGSGRPSPPLSAAPALVAAVGITPANVAVLKNGHAKAIRFTTLASICRVLDCQPGDILGWTRCPLDAPPPPDARHAHLTRPPDAPA